MQIYYLAFIILWSTPGYMTPSSSFESHDDELIDDTQLLVGDISNLYLDAKFSDVGLVVDIERLAAHRVVLASRSKYFSVLFYGDFKKDFGSDVNITEAPVTLFKIVLEYIYTGRINLSDLEDMEVFELLRISDFYGILNLKHSLNEYLKRTIKAHKVCSFHAMALLYQYKELEVESLNFIDDNVLDVLKSEDFLNLSTETLQEILNRDTFYAKELDIFRAVCRWINKNQNELVPDTKIKVLSDVRYSLMSMEEQSEARKSQLVSSDIISSAIRLRKSLILDKPQFRGQLKPDVNLSHHSQRFVVTNGNIIPWVQNFAGFNESNFEGGFNMIKLNNPSTINYIEIMLWNENIYVEDLRCFSYYIEVSMDQVNWIPVVNRSNYNCRSIQRLWIHPHKVQYIRIIEAKSTPNVTFTILDVKYNRKEMHKVEIKNGLFVPKNEYNVASKMNGAFVIKGENSANYRCMIDSYNGLVNENTYTYHLLKSGFIVIHLAQPFILTSMRILLWSDNDQAYSYTIEASVNSLDWEMIVDKSKELTQSWQLLHFKPTTVLYIRITGVSSSAGNDFRCVYIEAPAQVPLDSNCDVDYHAKK